MRGAATAGTGPTKRAPMSRGRGHDSTRPRVGGVVALFALLLIELLAAGFGVSTRPACCCRSRWRPRCTRRPGPSCPGDRHAGGAAAGADRGVAGLPGLPGRPALPNVSPAANLGRSGVWTGECRDADWCRSDRPASGLLDQPPSAPRFGALRGRPVKCAASPETVPTPIQQGVGAWVRLRSRSVSPDRRTLDGLETGNREDRLTNGSGRSRFGSSETPSSINPNI